MYKKLAKFLMYNNIDIELITIFRGEKKDKELYIEIGNHGNEAKFKDKLKKWDLQSIDALQKIY